MKTVRGHVGLIGAAVLVLLGVSLPRDVTAALFTYDSNCAATCGNFGLSGDDSISGTIEVSDAALGALAMVDTSDVLSFSFDGSLDAAGTAIASYKFAASGALFPAVGPASAATTQASSLTLVSVPEPPALTLFLLALGGLGLMLRTPGRAKARPTAP